MYSASPINYQEQYSAQPKEAQHRHRSKLCTMPRRNKPNLTRSTGAIHIQAKPATGSQQKASQWTKWTKWPIYRTYREVHNRNAGDYNYYLLVSNFSFSKTPEAFKKQATYVFGRINLSPLITSSFHKAIPMQNKFRRLQRILKIHILITTWRIAMLMRLSGICEKKARKHKHFRKNAGRSEVSHVVR